MKLNSPLDLLIADGLIVSLSGDGRRIIAVIEAYIDESGKHHEAPFLVVAAYFAPQSTWRAFNRDWQPILKQQNISCFHANIGQGLMLKSKTGYFMPPKSRVLRMVNWIKKWW